MTSQARVHALVVPIAPEVSGTVSSVSISNNQLVEAGQELFRIDAERYGYGVQTAFLWSGHRALFDIRAPWHRQLVAYRAIVFQVVAVSLLICM